MFGRELQLFEYLRGRELLDLVNDGDFVRQQGFLLEVGAAGDVVYTTALDPFTDVVESFEEGDVVKVCGMPLLLYSVKSNGTTATGLVAGYL